MRDPRLSQPSLVIAAHGSADPRFAETVDAIADRVRHARPDLEVLVGYLEHGPPHLTDVVAPNSVVVPLLLSAGYHVRIDLPDQVAGAIITPAVGPDPRLTDALVDRLREAGYAGGDIVLAAAGSADVGSLDDVRRAAGMLADSLDVGVTAAFVSAGEPRVADIVAADTTVAVAAYLVAPGAFQDALTASGAAVVSAPLGDHPAVGAAVLDRYDDATGRALS